MSVSKLGVVMMVDKTRRLRKSLLNFKTTPVFSVLSDKIMDDLLGKELFYHDFGAQKISAGKLAEKHLLSMNLKFLELYRANGNLWKGLLWEYKVSLNGLDWTLYYSAITGELVEIRQMFDT